MVSEITELGNDCFIVTIILRNIKDFAKKIADICLKENAVVDQTGNVIRTSSHGTVSQYGEHFSMFIIFKRLPKKRDDKFRDR